MVPALFVFGDSLVDVGNNNHLSLSIAKANFPHNGVDFVGKKATGRFSNGKNAADFLADKVGLPSSPPYLSIRSASNKTNAFIGGVSFASGGAGILDGTDKLFKQAIPLSKQIQYYTMVFTELVQQIGTVEAQKYFSKSLYALVIGSNDILGYFGGAGSNLHLKNTPQELTDSMTLMLKDYLKQLYNLGARKYVIVGVGAIGCCPSQRNQNKTGACKEETNYWSNKFNQNVKSLLQEMKTELKDINYVLFDTYNILLNFIQKPADYGFTEVKAACCGLGNLNANVPCLPIAKYCPKREDHVFWDLYHPTEAAAKIFVETIFDGPQQYAYPINVRKLVAL
ncbi:GDSL esterase/lipase [Thalictrum thalictroides]|uniref:GDSL esterase/lipase n=1 Tax=Thalictrum thalictroides TaxID=46969 RepID=A0A7J6WFF5_THATH|nr:GDSL esterase/lipase [Thalictrum thalictroides]